MENQENIKSVLFNETRKMVTLFVRLKNQYGFYDERTKIAHGKFLVLYQVIEESGLEDDYQDFQGRIEKDAI